MRWLPPVLMLAACRTPAAMDPPAPAPVVDDQTAEPVRVVLGPDTIEIAIAGDVWSPPIADWDAVDVAMREALARSQADHVRVRIADEAAWAQVAHVLGAAHGPSIERFVVESDTGASYELAASAKDERPVDCTRARVHVGGRGWRLDVATPGGDRRIGRVSSLDDIDDALADLDPKLCADAVIEISRRGPQPDTWLTFAEVGRALAALGVTALELDDATMFAAQRYEPFAWAETLARLRVSELHSNEPVSMHPDGPFLAVGPALGRSSFEGPMPEWPPVELVLELPAGENVVDAYGVEGMAEQLPECGTVVTLLPHKETRIYRNQMHRSCSLAPEPQPDPRVVEGQRLVTIVRDAGKNERRPWLLQVSGADDANEAWLRWIVPPTVRELSIHFPRAPLELSLHEVDFDPADLTRACMRRMEPSNCPNLELQRTQPCVLRIDDPSAQEITYRPGRSCKARQRPGR